MVPRLSRQQLPADGAELAVNCGLLSGDLRAFRAPYKVAVLGPEFISHHAFRIPAAKRTDAAFDIPTSSFSNNDIWVEFPEEFSHFVDGPLVNDSHNRWFFTQRGEPPRYNTQQRLIDGDPHYRLGVPAPLTALTVVASGGTDDLAETRCYVYTFIDIYGQESAPSEPTCAEGNADGTWTLSGMDTAMGLPWNTEGAPLDKKRIYRTVTGETGGSFFFVADVDPATVSYDDSLSTDDVSLNPQLESDLWGTPPETLVGIVNHPNGFLVGFEDSTGDIWFSVPYRPHAWMVETVLSVEGKPQALGVFGQSIVVATDGHPSLTTGTNPAGMTLIKSDTPAPCVSEFSVVSVEGAVLYASPDGIVSISSGGVVITSQALVARGEWRTRYNPSEIRACKAGFSYLAFAPFDDPALPRRGLMFAPREASSSWSELYLTNQHLFRCLQTDLYSGRPYTIYNDTVYLLDEPLSIPEVYTWRSWEFVTNKPCNFGAYRIDFDQFTRYPEQGPDDETGIGDVGGIGVEEATAYNIERIVACPLDPLNFHAIGMVRQCPVTPPNDEIVQNKQPMGGSPLFSIASLGNVFVTVRLYANGSLKYEKTLRGPGRFRLPIGYKHDLWQLEFEGNADLHHFKMAETGKELASV